MLNFDDRRKKDKGGGEREVGPLVVIAGETASGKTALAITLAERFGGEIISADSRTVYTEMDIGTAKPSREERTRVPHHLLDVVRPDKRFTVADFKRLAGQTIADIHARGKLPFLVGGSGLYIDAVIYDFELLPPPDPQERGRLQTMTVEALQAEIRRKGYPMPTNEQNPRHLTRVIETAGVSARRQPLRPNTLLIGIALGRDELKKRIIQRTDSMIEQGLVDEVRRVGEKYGWNAPALQAPAYRAFRKYFSGAVSLEAAREEFIKSDIGLAKKQRTWFKRNSSIHWIAHLPEAGALVEKFLHNSS